MEKLKASVECSKSKAQNTPHESTVIGQLKRPGYDSLMPSCRERHSKKKTYFRTC